jgi:hypothetical protein
MYCGCKEFWAGSCQWWNISMQWHALVSCHTAYTSSAAVRDWCENAAQVGMDPQCDSKQATQGVVYAQVSQACQSAPGGGQGAAQLVP